MPLPAPPSIPAAAVPISTTGAAPGLGASAATAQTPAPPAKQQHESAAPRRHASAASTSAGLKTSDAPAVEVPAVPPVPGVPAVPVPKTASPLPQVPAPVPAGGDPQPAPVASPPVPAAGSGSHDAGSASHTAAPAAPARDVSARAARRSSARTGTGGLGAHAAALRPLTAAPAGAGVRPNARRAARPTAAASPGFVLRAAPVATRAGGSGSMPLPDIHPFGPVALAANDAGLLETILLIAGGALLIALMCADALGAGPRHDYVRRRAGSWRLPWR